MKILIVTAWYAPFIHPRAHRWSTIAAQWASRGHEVHVLTARVGEGARHETLEGVMVHRVGFDSLKEWVYYWFGSKNARGRVGRKPQKQGIAGRVAAWCYQAIWKRLYFPDDAVIWYFPARKKMCQLLKEGNFDALVTVSLPFTGHLLGLYAMEHHIAPFWLADMGDPFSFQAKAPNNTFMYGRKNRRLEQGVLQTAQAVTVTTAATLSLYRAQFGDGAVVNMSVVPPLLKVNNLTKPSREASPSRRIKIGYFGSMYAPTRTPDAFLHLLEQTFLHRPTLREHLEIHFYGEIFPEFFARLSNHPNLQLHGLCTRDEAWTAMSQMDVLLNIGNITDFQLPSKAVEYLASGKPIAHISYVEHDPFVAFFEGEETLLSLRVVEGRFQRGELMRWIDWLESEKPAIAVADREKSVAPFLAENIARKYLELMGYDGR